MSIIIIASLLALILSCNSFSLFTSKTRSLFRLSAFPELKDGVEDDKSNNKKFIDQTFNIWFRKKRHKEPGRLILVRHGESENNANSTFTGWVDSDITENGHREMEYAARLMLERGYTDVDIGNDMIN